MSGYKFPDEQEADDKNIVAAGDDNGEERNEVKVEVSADGDDVEIEIVDDTPPQDRGRKPLEREVNDPTEEEIDGYSEGVKKRIKELTHARHDERRAKEALLREKQELERIAQLMVEENKKLKQYVQTGTEQYVASQVQVAENEVDKAKAALKAATESFDTEAIIAAQEALMEAKFKVQSAKSFKPAPLQEETVEVKTPQNSDPAPELDQKTLNKTLEPVLKNASLAVSGVYTAADDGVINPQNVKIQPGAIIPVARNGGPQGPSLTPLPKSADFNVAQLVINDMRMNIKKMLLDDTLPPDNMSARSATEVVQRRNELAQNLGAAFGRLITEAMVPIVSRILFIMDQNGDIDLPLKINGEEVKIVPISPLAQAQNMEELNDVMQFVQIVAGMGPEAMMTIKKDEIIDFVAERLGVPGKLLTTPEEREQIAQQYGQMQAMAQQQQAQAAAPQGAGNQEALMRSLQ